MMGYLEISNDHKKTRVIDNLSDDFTVDWGVKAIGADKMWRHTKGEGVRVAIMDTGIDMDHDDLKGKVVNSHNPFTSSRDVIDSYGHGTHVAGVIAGDKTGIAPHVDLLISNSLNHNGLGTADSIMEGISFAINNDADILCMSLGIDRPLPSGITMRLRRAVREGVTIVCATGNQGKQSIHHPACLDYVVGVGGANQDLELASFSNYGLEMDTLAPAVDILSTYKDNNYAYMSGTSVATPLVAGGLALVKSYYRNKGIELSPKEIKQKLELLGGRRSRRTGHGLFDISKILRLGD